MTTPRNSGSDDASTRYPSHETLVHATVMLESHISDITGDAGGASGGVTAENTPVKFAAPCQFSVASLIKYVVLGQSPDMESSESEQSGEDDMKMFVAEAKGRDAACSTYPSQVMLCGYCEAGCHVTEMALGEAEEESVSSSTRRL